MKIFQPSFLYADFVNLDSDDCKRTFSEFFDNLALNADIVEVGTNRQYLNKNLEDARKVLITASNMGSVCKRKKRQPDNLLKVVRGYNPPPSSVKSIQLGKIYERQALKNYAKKKKNTQSFVMGILNWMKRD